MPLSPLRVHEGKFGCHTIYLKQGDDRIDAAEWRFLISGMSPGQSQLNNPDPTWIEVNVWGEIRALCGLDYFKEFAAMFAQRTVAWRRWENTAPRQCFLMTILSINV